MLERTIQIGRVGSMWSIEIVYAVAVLNSIVECAIRVIKEYFAYITLIRIEKTMLWKT